MGDAAPADERDSADEEGEAGGDAVEAPEGGCERERCAARLHPVGPLSHGEGGDGAGTSAAADLVWGVPSDWPPLPRRGGCCDDTSSLPLRASVCSSQRQLRAPSPCPAVCGRVASPAASPACVDGDVVVGTAA